MTDGRELVAGWSCSFFPSVFTNEVVFFLQVPQVAAKIIHKGKAPKDYVRKFLPREMRILEELEHPNVVSRLLALPTATHVPCDA